MLIILSFKFKEIDLCSILLLSAIFSITWRSIKIIKGKETIEKDNYIKNPFFILDFGFAILALLCVLFSKQINKKFLLFLFLIFVLSWILTFICDSNDKSDNNNNNNNNNLKNKIISTSQTIHFCGHCYLILIVFITFYINIH
jgi:uncharacterized membrane protein YfcA